MNDAVRVYSPSRVFMGIRVLVMTVLITLFCFAIGLFIGIVSMALGNAVRGGGINMAFAYEKVAMPLAIVGFVAGIVISVRSEISFYRRRKIALLQEYEGQQFRRVA